jgi:hypothetical protein
MSANGRWVLTDAECSGRREKNSQGIGLRYPPTHRPIPPAERRIARCERRLWHRGCPALARGLLSRHLHPAVRRLRRAPRPWCARGSRDAYHPIDNRKQEFAAWARCDEVLAFLSTVADEYETVLNDNKACANGS